MAEKRVLLGWLLVTVVEVVARVVVLCAGVSSYRPGTVRSLVGSIFGINFKLNCRNAILIIGL